MKARAITAIVIAGTAALVTTATAAKIPLRSGMVAFVTDRMGGQSDVWTMAADGSAQRVVLQITNRDERLPKWSPNGRRIAFVSGNLGLLITDPDGTHAVRPIDGNVFDFDWSPDGTRLVYSDGDNLFTVRVDGTSRHQLTSGPSIDAEPRWSPDGDRIAYVGTGDGNKELYSVSAAGGPATRLTNAAGADEHPAWSPNGTRLAFVSKRDGNYEIYTIAADGSNPVDRTLNAAADIDPAWSADGQRIAFASDRAGSLDLYRMAADGTGQTRLTTIPGGVTHPQWAADGRSILFVAGGSIAVVAANGGTPKKLAVLGHNADPSWQRLSSLRIISLPPVRSP